MNAAKLNAWLDAVGVYFTRRMAVVFLLGVCSGLPNGLITGTLGVWLREHGLSRTDIGVVGLVGLVYAVNFLWAPFLDRLRPFGLGWLGRRRAWIVLFQIALVLALAQLLGIDPLANLRGLVLVIAAIAILSASQDIVIDAYRVEYLRQDEYAAGSAMATMGWMTGATVLAGFTVLHLSGPLGWPLAYLAVGGVLLAGPLVLALAGEPKVPAEVLRHDTSRPWRTRLHDTLVAPFSEFLRRPHAWLVLAFVLLFKLGEAMIGRMTGVFYIDTGFTPAEIANYSKALGTGAMLLGGAIGGVIAKRFGLYRALLGSAIAMAATNLLYAWLALAGKDFSILALAIVADNLTTGLSLSIFVAFVSSLCNVAFTATQYALLASLANFAMRGAASLGGLTVDWLEKSRWVAGTAEAWAAFFVFTALLALPGIFLLVLLGNRLPVMRPPSAAAARAAQA
ncbi:AmpG family muropeptide MFS transporter [Rehaibacterium terrae]|uniref:PAT family beta-lactamase induction signal transducer AmpG n=1 Tax=Rehaibacterium terrae TaxID=1341696 RepID=A0A7W7Y194_9GAMM|nr:MFS transporter [Rehaibacterium terrae]MBB5016195.1 PAT family beta-lactamase induction signal transducer AmpG [Rehaibacterium terrae]